MDTAPDRPERDDQATDGTGSYAAPSSDSEGQPDPGSGPESDTPFGSEDEQLDTDGEPGGAGEPTRSE